MLNSRTGTRARARNWSHYPFYGHKELNDALPCFVTLGARAQGSEPFLLSPRNPLLLRPKNVESSRRRDDVSSASSFHSRFIFAYRLIIPLLFLPAASFHFHFISADLPYHFQIISAYAFESFSNHLLNIYLLNGLRLGAVGFHNCP